MLFASLPNVVWIRIDGKGSFAISGQLRDFVMRKIGTGAARFVIDLDRCSVVDSTFMGTLLGIFRDLSIVKGGLLDVVNANARNVQLLRNLGLTNIISVDERAERWKTERKKLGQDMSPCDGAPLDKQATASVMLEAHEALAKARPENAARFEDVIHFLKKDLKENGSAAC